MQPFNRRDEEKVLKKILVSVALFVLGANAFADDVVKDSVNGSINWSELLKQRTAVIGRG